MTRVLFVNYSEDITGADLSLLSLVKHLPMECSVLMLSEGPFLEQLGEEDVSTFVIKGYHHLLSQSSTVPLVRRLYAVRELPRLVEGIGEIAKDYDLIYINSKKAILPSIMAARKLRMKAIYHQRDPILRPPILSLRKLMSEKVTIWILNWFVSRVICISQATAKTFIDAGGNPYLPVIIYNGIDPRPFADSQAQSEFRDQQGLPPDIPLIGCFGQLMAWKGQRVLIQALTKIPEAHVVIVGRPIASDPYYLTRLREIVERLGLVERVHFLGFRKDVPMLMKAMDIIVHTSVEFEPLGRVVIEGMMSGRPVIATSVGGVPELIQNGKSGLLVPPGRPEALAAAVTRLLEDPEFAAHIAREGQKRALKHFSLNRMINAVASEIQAVMAS